MKPLIAGLGLGAGCMYLNDPQNGRRRRALLRDRLVHWGCAYRKTQGKATRDLRNRLRGTGHDLAARLPLGTTSEADDEVVRERVRSRMGRYVSHPHSIHVEVESGVVELSGPILADEVEGLRCAVEKVAGVERVLDRLEPHDDPGREPGLQGAGRRQGERMELLQESWSPSTRFLVGLAGGVLLAAGSLRRDLLTRLLASGAGMTLLGRSLSNRPYADLVGRGEEPRAVDLQKTISVEAGVGDVYALWSHPESFPFFMRHVTEVQPLGEDVYLWRARGPAGAEVSWQAAVTERVPNERVSWRSLPGSTVDTHGTVHFAPEGDGGRTRLHIRMSYAPPGGALGHLVASLFGDDAKHAMDEDLVRFKSLFEDGKTTNGHRKVHLEEVLGSVEPAPSSSASPTGEEPPSAAL